MKTNIITGEGVCGLQINLNILDMHEITILVEKYQRHMAEQEVHDTWRQGQYDDAKRIQKDPETGEETVLWKKYDWDAYKAIYPEPEVTPFDFENEMAIVMRFLKKCIIEDSAKPSVFDE